MFFFSKHRFYNKKLSDYCKESTIESIRRITEIYNKRKQLITCSTSLVPPLVPPLRIINICVFISISSILFYFFSSTKINKLKNI